MSFEIELGSLGLFKPGLYFILRAQSSLMVSLLPLGLLLYCEGSLIFWSKTKRLVFFHRFIAIPFFLLFSKREKQCFIHLMRVWTSTHSTY